MTSPSISVNARSVESSGVLKAAGAMGAATFLSRIFGLVREQVFAYLFGAGNLTDAFNVAFRIPNLLRDLFAEGAMSASLVPTFTKTRIEEGDDRAWRVAGLVFRVLTVIVSALALVGVVFAPQLVSLYADAFKAIPGKFELTVQLTRIMFPFFPLVALAAAFMGILNSCGVFFLPAFASALFNVVSVGVGVSVVWILNHGGSNWGISPIAGMAIGVVAGGAIQAFCQLPMLYKKGYHWVSRRESQARSVASLGEIMPPWFRDPRLRQMLWLMVPGTLGLAATQINLLVNTILATSQGTGAVSWLNFSFRLMQFPIGIFGVSLAAATLPRVSTLWVKKDYVGVSDTLTQSIKNVFALNLPASAGLAFLGIPIIELIFQYGRFQPSDTAATAKALAMYSIGLTAYSAVKVLVPACYALGNTRIPVISSVLAVVLTIVLNLMTVGPFGYWGLALGTSLAAILNAGFLLVSIQKMLKDRGSKFPFFPLFKGFLEYLSIALFMGIACYYSAYALEFILPDSWFSKALGSMGMSNGGIPLGRALRLGAVICEGVLILLFAGKIFNLKETNEVVDILGRKMKNKIKWR